MDELASLIRTEIPDGRQNLRDSFANLERVAEYCEDTYYRYDKYNKTVFSCFIAKVIIFIVDLKIKKQHSKKPKIIQHNRWLVLLIK